jgi:hypothetical protein
MSSSGCLFPEWRREFVDPAVETTHQEQLCSSARAPELIATAMAGVAPLAGFSRSLLPQLDLGSVAPRGEEDAPSESIMKRQKFALFEKQCSQVAEGLFVSGEFVAKSRDVLRAHGITHVVNCVGAMYPEFFKADGVQYKTLWLQGERRGVVGGSPTYSGGRLALIILT